MEPGFAAEYLALHEDILRRWREGVRDSAELLARYSLEELAFWYVGGILTRGVGLLFEAVAPTAMRVLTRGGVESAGWLRTTLFRIPKAERKVFERLWTKVQLEGAEALSRLEKNELVALMNRLERLVRSPLSKDEKEVLRAAARRYYKKLHSVRSEAMELKGPFEVHHRRPLEYAHLFPERDINASENLRGVGEEVHQSINSLWNEFRSKRTHARADEVDRVAAIVDAHFGRWYDVPHAVGDSASALGEAVKAARRELAEFLAGS
ncbi:hypothetical protein F0U60_45430 [Archangium minus]|uniref:HEPN AbiU2-like domain-containing protein n=1 Tax=Archangium minus TaxID=83450 RepID=A0ABY9X596_9BACT|nr:hypothetical protein F0U60_45430 [Archangium minus]